jgi:hypothetical protein
MGYSSHRNFCKNLQYHNVAENSHGILNFCILAFKCCVEKCYLIIGIENCWNKLAKSVVCALDIVDFL